MGNTPTPTGPWPHVYFHNAPIAKGLDAAGRALAINPRSADAELLRGTHLLLAARASRDPAVRQKKMEEARRALARAVELDPLQKRAVEKVLPISN